MSSDDEDLGGELRGKLEESTPGETYAVVRLGRIPHRIFDDFDSAVEYLENHDRLDYENASVIWPVPSDGGDDE